MFYTFIAASLPALYRVPDLAFESLDALIESTHSLPQAATLASRFGGVLSLEGLCLPLARSSPWSESRMVVLWLLRKFDCFDSRCCRCCSLPIKTQSHVTLCGGLTSKVTDDPRLPQLPAHTDIAPFSVERLLMAAISKSPHVQRIIIGALSSHILTCVLAVYGDQQHQRT